MRVLVVGQKGRQIRRCIALRGSANDDIGTVVRLCGIGRSIVAVLHARRHPCGGGVARGLVEGDAGGAFLRIEGGFERCSEHRLLVVGVIASPAIAEDFAADRERMSLLHAAPVIGGRGAPVILEADAKTAAGGLNDRVGAALDRELRFERGGDAPGKKALLLLNRLCSKGGEAIRGRQLVPAELQNLPFGGEPAVRAGAGEVVQRAARLTFRGAHVEGP